MIASLPMTELRPLYALGFGGTMTVVLLLLLRVGQRVFSPGHTVGGDLAQANSARRFLQVGQVLAVFMIAAAAVKNCVEGTDLKRDILWAIAMGATGLALLLVSGRVGLMLLLRSRLPQEIERGNIAAGVAAGAHYVATGIITSRAVAGNDLPSLGLSLVFFVLAQITLHIFVSLFRALTVYDDAEQIQGENLAAAISYGGVAIAVAILIARALEGDFVSWGVSLKGYGVALLFAFALWPVRQILVQSLLLGYPFALRGGKLDEGIAGARNEGMAVLEAVAYLATSLSIARLA
jgi:uncharacterized membrane protein YjfL (UPF0719 family)